MALFGVMSSVFVHVSFSRIVAELIVMWDRGGVGRYSKTEALFW